MPATLIVALDVDTRAEAEAIVERLGDAADFYKIGYQLCYGGDGLALGTALIAAGKRLFFDLKLLDIDNTVAKGAAAIARTGASLLTVHAYPRALAAAVEATAGSGLGILGVTVLTAMDDADLLDAGYGVPASELVSQRTARARDIGVAGIVCSPLEAAAVRAILGPDGAVVTPGIRPAGSAADDQKRATTPEAAVASGASHLVVGRPITTAPDPLAAASAIRRSLG